VKVRRRLHKGQLGPPKARYGRRDVLLSPGMPTALWNLDPKAAAAGEQSPLFAGERGRAQASTAYRAVRAAATAAELGDWVGLHTLRHTCATILFKRGLNAKQVQVWLGHHSPAFTLATYVHLLSDDLPAADFLDEVAAPEGGTRVVQRAARRAEINPRRPWPKGRPQQAKASAALGGSRPCAELRIRARRFDSSRGHEPLGRAR
jgi:integrase